MERVIDLLIEEKGKFKGRTKDLSRLVKKIESTWHAPVSEKQTKRMLPFTAIPEIRVFVNDSLFGYFKKSNYFAVDASGLSYYDIKGVWYLFTLLVYSDKRERTVVYMIEQLIEAKNPALSIARRILNLCKNAVYKEQLDLVEAFFKEQNKTTKLYKWLRTLDVIHPEGFNWEFTISIKSRLNSKEGQTFEDHFFIVLKGFEPKGDGKSFELKLSNKKQGISSCWDDFSADNFIRFGNKTIELSMPPSVEKLPEFVRELEAIFELRFELKFNSQFFSKGFKNKNNIQKWLLKRMQ